MASQIGSHAPSNIESISPDSSHTVSWVSGVLRHVGRIICAVDGHSMMVRNEPKRVCLECTTCGYQTPGWEVGSAVLNRIDQGIPRQQADAAVPPLVGAPRHDLELAGI